MSIRMDPLSIRMKKNTLLSQICTAQNVTALCWCTGGNKYLPANTNIWLSIENSTGCHIKIFIDPYTPMKPVKSIK